jgi:hypothetical protein
VELPLQLKKGIPHNHVDLPPLVSVEAAGACILVGNCETHLASFYSGNLQAVPGVMLSSLSSQISDVSPFWPVI